MGSSLTLFRLFGIEVRVHWSFLLILAYGAFFYSNSQLGQIGGALFGILTILLLFVCVTLHEFGHALVAQSYHVEVPHITLLPIGGVASLERIPEKPLQEFNIAVAGPLVNFAIALILLPLRLLMTGDPFWPGVDTLMRQMQEPNLAGIVTFLIVTNLTLGIFNLLPAFPMDGGRVLRALLAMTMPYVRATNIAVFVGRVMAGLLFLWGIFGGGVFLMLIAFFVYVGGGSERHAVASRHVLRDVQARDALTAKAEKLYTSEKMGRAVDLIMSSYQTDYPVFDLSNNYVGVLTRARLVDALKTVGPDGRIPDAMIAARHVPECAPTANLADVWDTMLQSGMRVTAVKEDGQFLGLITIDDVTELFQVIGARLDGEYLRQESGPHDFSGNRPSGTPTPSSPQSSGDV
ncbi:MAG: site-2 protease family protein [Caldilineaceae bacterium]